MKLCFISDTHNKHDEVPIGKGDILFHMGDFTRKGSLEDVKSFAKWIGTQDFEHIVVIAGNHDFSFDDMRNEEAERMLKENGVNYLNDSGITIEGLNIWGSPITPWFHDWAFNRNRGDHIKSHWDLIPKDTDILLTHGPPKDILDLCFNGERVGCEMLSEKIDLVQPKIHAFGHIHEGYGCLEKDGILFLNACNLDESYKYSNNPIELEFDTSSKSIVITSGIE